MPFSSIVWMIITFYGPTHSIRFSISPIISAQRSLKTLKIQMHLLQGFLKSSLAIFQDAKGISLTLKFLTEASQDLKVKGGNLTSESM